MSEPYYDEQRQPDEGCEFCSVIDIDSDYEGARADSCPVCGAPGGGCITCLASLRCDP